MKKEITLSSCTIYILAGGQSSRMGSDKGLCEIKGRPMIEWVVSGVKDLGIQLVIISNNLEYKKFGYPVIPDVIPNKGPLGGIYTALKHSSTERNIVLSCDSPFVNGSIVERLFNQSENEEMAIASYENNLYPLIGLYSKSLIPRVFEALEKNELKLTRFCKSQQVKIIPFKIDENQVTSFTFENMNTPEDLSRINALNIK